MNHIAGRLTISFPQLSSRASLASRPASRNSPGAWIVLRVGKTGCYFCNPLRESRCTTSFTDTCASIKRGTLVTLPGRHGTRHILQTPGGKRMRKDPARTPPLGFCTQTYSISPSERFSFWPKQDFWRATSYSISPYREFFFPPEQDFLARTYPSLGLDGFCWLFLSRKDGTFLVTFFSL